MELNLTKNAMFLGATRAPRPEADSLLPEPKLGNVTDPVKVREAREKKVAKARASAMHWPMTGYIHQLVLIDWGGEVLLSVECAQGETFSTATHFCNLLAKTPAIIPRLVNEPRTCLPVRWFGFDIRVTLSMLALEAMRYNSIQQQPAAQQPVPWHIWWHHHFTTPPYLDPFEMILPSTVRSASGFEPLQVAQYFGLASDSQLSPAQQQAVFARNIVRCSGALAGLGA